MSRAPRSRAAWMPRTAFLAALAVLGLPQPWASADALDQWMPSFQYESKGRRDPFAPLVRDGKLVGVEPGRHVETTKPVLYGVLWDPGGHSIALINDTEVQVGDTVAEWQVLEIRENAVVLKNGGEPVVLNISFHAPPSALTSGATTGGHNR